MSGSMLVIEGEQARTIEWDPTDKESVESAEAEFDRLTTSNLAYEVKEGKKTQVKKFDPQAEELVITRPLVGG